MELDEPRSIASAPRQGDVPPTELRRAIARACETRRAFSCEDAWAVRRAFFAGEMTIVDRLAMDGGDCLLARRRGPSEGRAALSEHEGKVLESVVSGCGNKQCACELGLAVPTVAFHLTRAMAKIGVASRVELVRLFVALDVDANERAASFHVAEFVSCGASFLAVWLRADSLRGGEALTRGEKEVLKGLLAGVSSAAIANARGTSARTVANQIASIFQKLGVRSRGELAAMREQTK